MYGIQKDPLTSEAVTARGTLQADAETSSHWAADNGTRIHPGLLIVCTFFASLVLSAPEKTGRRHWSLTCFRGQGKFITLYPHLPFGVGFTLLDSSGS